MYDLKAVPVEERWSIVYGAADGSEQRALELLCEGLSSYITEYCLEIRQAEEAPAQGSQIWIGVGASNRKITEILGETELPEQGYRLKVMKKPDQPERQLVLLVGGDLRGLLYGCVEFLYQYLPAADHAFSSQLNFYSYRLLDANCEQKSAMTLPETDILRAPKIQKRGLWTWGHVIYDYRGFLDNMLKTRMNEVVVWNDHPPVNGKDFAAYAHRNGIEVLWGFSWAWGVDLDISAEGELEKWKKIILAQYRDHYAQMGGDGIYFQTFTESKEDTKDGKSIAAEAVRWVNAISGALLEQYPDLRIQFGLHATSVREHMDEIAQTDPRVEIIWEDCGAFPYSYASHDVDHFEETAEFTDQMIHQRACESCGAVMKGMVCLDWNHFEYKTGPFLLGHADARFRRDRTELKRRYWRYVQSDWLCNAEYCRKILRQMADGCHGRADVLFLVEDGMFEEALWFPVVLAAEMLWDSERPMQEMIHAAARRRDVEFA